MRKVIITITSIILVAALVFMTGCTGTGKKEADEPVAHSLVLGTHSNFPSINLSAEMITNPIYEACYTYSDLSAVTVEGTPRIVCNYSINKPDKAISKSKRNQIARDNTKAISQTLAGVAATTPEADVLKAIRLSANLLHGSDASKMKMTVVDNGILTTGTLKQTSKDYLSADPQTVAQKLSEKGALPNLKGISVTWIGLCATSANGIQAEIPDSYQAKMLALWSAIIKASGGEVIFDYTPLQGNEKEGLPPVTAVIFPKDILDIDVSGPKSVKEPVKIDDTSLKFKGDSATFTDVNLAKETLSPFADLLINNPGLKICIAGTTATVPGTDGIELSKRRADKCKEILVGLGADSKRIECIGLGSAENMFHVDDTDENGNRIEEIAKLNRAIYIFSADSETARTLNA